MRKYTLTGFADEIDPQMSVQYQLLKKLGINHIELRGVNGKNISELTHGEADVLANELEKNGMKISALGSPVGKIKMDEDFDAHFRMFEKLLAFADILGTKYIRVFSFYTYGKNVINRDEVFRRTEKMIARAARENIVLLHENEKHIYGDTFERCLELMEKFCCDNYKCTFDFANFVQCGSDTIEAYNALKPYIEYIHIKDALKAGGHIVPAGSGDGNLETILADAVNGGYDGFLSLEPHLSHFHGLDALEGGKADKNDTLAGDKAFTLAYDSLNKILLRIDK